MSKRLAAALAALMLSASLAACATETDDPSAVIEARRPRAKLPCCAPGCCD